MTIDPQDLAEARRLAEEATPGPWHYKNGMVGPDPAAGDGVVSTPWTNSQERRREIDADAAFIAHCNPAFVLELVREVERLRRVEEAARPIIERHAEQIRRLTAGMPDEVAGTYLAEVEAAEVALANPAAEAGACEHDWIDMRNQVITSGEWCRKCNAIRANPAAEAGE